MSINAMAVRRRQWNQAEFLQFFNDIRGELESSLFSRLGNREDAKDATQETFLKCSQQSLADIRNMRAWIFRVGLNRAEDLRRNGWRKRARPLVGDYPTKNGSEAEILPGFLEFCHARNTNVGHMLVTWERLDHEKRGRCLIREVAANLGVTEPTLRKWRKDAASLYAEYCKQS
jgi:DNA-directed RNA polymerase specialized sigma24 family protein